MPYVGLQFVIVVFPDHTHLLFIQVKAVCVVCPFLAVPSAGLLSVHVACLVMLACLMVIWHTNELSNFYDVSRYLDQCLANMGFIPFY